MINKVKVIMNEYIKTKSKYDFNLNIYQGL